MSEITWDCQGDCGAKVAMPMKYCLNCQIDYGITASGDDAPLPDPPQSDAGTEHG